MAFTFYPNVSGLNWASSILSLRDKLITAGWILMGNGDGLAAFSQYGGTFGSPTPATSVLTGSSPGSEGVANANTNRRAWLWLRSPDGRELLWQRDAFNTGSDEGSVRYAPSGFGSLGLGALSATVGPTGATEINILSNNRDPGATTGNSWGGNLGTAAQKWDFAIGDASEGYSFYALGRTSPGGVYQGGMLYDRVANADAADLDPTVVCMARGTSSGTDSIFLTSKQNLTDARGDFAVKNQTGSRSGGTADLPWAYELDPSTELGAARMFIPRFTMTFGTGSSVEVHNPGGVNPYSGNYDLVEDVYWWSTNVASVGMLPGVAARGLIKGKSRLIIGLGSTGGIANMDTNTALTRACAGLGGYWILWDGVTAPVL